MLLGHQNAIVTEESGMSRDNFDHNPHRRMVRLTSSALSYAFTFNGTLVANAAPGLLIYENIATAARGFFFPYSHTPNQLLAERYLRRHGLRVPRYASLLRTAPPAPAQG